MASTLSSRTFLLNFWFSLTNILVVSSRLNLAHLLVSVQTIEFNGVDNTGFLKSSVVLMFLFMFIDLLESNC